MSSTINATIAAAAYQPDTGKTVLANLLANYFAWKQYLEVVLLDLDTENAGAQGTSIKNAMKRPLALPYHVLSADGKKEAGATRQSEYGKVTVIDISRAPTNDQVATYKEHADHIYIPVTSNDKSLREAAKLYRELQASGHDNMVIVPNLVAGGSHESISGYFDSLEARVAAVAMPKVLAVSELIRDGLPLQVARAGELAEVAEAVSFVTALVSDWYTPLEV